MGLNIDEHIEKAYKDGHFDKLSGTGKPLALKKNPFAPDEQLGHEIVKNSGYSLPWIEEKREIEAEIDIAVNRLKRVWLSYDGTRQAVTDWAAAKAAFLEKIKQINSRILTFNLKSASPQLHLYSVSGENVIVQVQKGE